MKGWGNHGRATELAYVADGGSVLTHPSSARCEQRTTDQQRRTRRRRHGWEGSLESWRGHGDGRRDGIPWRRGSWGLSTLGCDGSGSICWFSMPLNCCIIHRRVDRRQNRRVLRHSEVCPPCHSTWQFQHGNKIIKEGNSTTRAWGGQCCHRFGGG